MSFEVVGNVDENAKIEVVVHNANGSGGPQRLRIPEGTQLGELVDEYMSANATGYVAGQYGHSVNRVEKDRGYVLVDNDSVVIYPTQIKGQ